MRCYAHINERIEAVIYVKNKDIMPIAVSEIEIESKIYAFSVPCTEAMTVEMPLKPRETEQIKLHFSVCDYSYMEISVKRIRLRDFLGIFKISKRISKSRGISVIPILPDNTGTKKNTDIEPNTKIALNDFAVASRDYSLPKINSSGYDFDGLREYRFGDKRSLLHHKLSAKSEIDYVKNMVESDLPDLILLLKMEMEENKIGADQKQINAQILEKFTKYGVRLLNADITFTGYLYGYKINMVRIKTHDQFINLLINVVKLYSTQKYNEYNIDTTIYEHPYLIVVDKTAVESEIHDPRDI
jgi:hypothetical protein